MSCPRLPIELFSEISIYLPNEDILNLALTNRDVYGVVIGRFYRRIELASLNDDTLAVGMQKKSMQCIRALLDDEKKRSGVERLMFLGVGAGAFYTDADEVSEFPEPYRTIMKDRRNKWLLTQPLFNQLVNALLAGNFEFPRLRTVYYDIFGLLTEVDTERFFGFLRRNPGIRNIIIQGDLTEAFNKWTFSRPPNDLVCCLANLERTIIYGPMLPLLLGFTLLDRPAGEFGPLTRSDTMPDTLPLKRVHICWPQRVVRVADNNEGPGGAPLSVKLDILDVIKALASVCASSLEVLVVGVDDGHIDEDLISLVSDSFPNLRELQFGPGRSDPMAKLPDHDFLCRLAEILSNLKILNIFEYRNVSHDSEQRLQYAEVLEHGEHWNDTAAAYARNNPRLHSIRLYSQTWNAAVLPIRKIHWG